MTLRWKVLDEASRFRGLQLEGIRRTATLRLEASGGWLLRLAAFGKSVFLARADWDFESWARITNPDVRVSVVPKLTAADVRAVKAEAGSDDWWLAWAKHFATALGEGALTPLFPSKFWLEPVRERTPKRPWWDPAMPQPANWLRVLQDLGAHEAEPLGAFQIIALRPPSPATADRVKVWRKHARAGTLPPVLLWYWPGALDVFLVLDGHDRLRAAALEKVAPRFLRLGAVADARRDHGDLEAMMSGIARSLERPGAKPQNVENLNRMIVDAHRTELFRLALRAWPMKQAAWTKEVRAVARAVGVVPEILGFFDRAP